MKLRARASIHTNGSGVPTEALLQTFLGCSHGTDNIELDIPNTTNATDGHFADVKNKLRNNNGLSMPRRMKFIDEFLKA